MRIAIVDDRALAIEAVRRVLVQVPGYQVAWVARDGEEAVRRAAADRPDLILMDLIMPGMNGAEATRRIMTTNPCPIVIVTATLSGNFSLVYDALAAGAVDAVNTPTLGLDGSMQGGDVLLAKIAQVAKKVKSSGLPTSPMSHPSLPAIRKNPPLLAIGASTGGPQAIADVLAQLPTTYTGAVLIVQHLGSDFTAGLADWIGSKVRLPVRLAKPGERPTPGTALIAGRDDHLVMTGDGILTYTPYPQDTPFRPNVDALFKSLADHWVGADTATAVLLTGMGRDGAEGLLKLRRAGWSTYAQDSASCVVAGMPEAAARIGAAGHVLPPCEIGKAIASGRR